VAGVTVGAAIAVAVGEAIAAAVGAGVALPHAAVMRATTANRLARRRSLIRSLSLMRRA
jgi:hypothetical protein